MPDPLDRRRLLMIVALVLAWGSTFAAVKIGLRDAPPLVFAGMRSVAGGLVMAAMAIALRRRAGLRQHLASYTALTALNVIGFFSLPTLAIHELPSGLASVLIYLQPVLTGVLAGPLLGEHVGRTALLGLALGFSGIVAVGVGAASGHVSALGILYAVLAALVWALGTIAVARTRVDTWWAVALPFTVGGIALWVVGAGSAPVTWTGGFVAALSYSALIGTALSWGLWFALVGAGQASRTAAVIFFVPLVSLVIGTLVLGESLHPSLLLGAALVVLGVWLVNRRSAA
ncbi:MAG TPA: DMT family transporter [Nocardioides sp.]|nr:DMT family transporter [Nocardioides sp.]